MRSKKHIIILSFIIAVICLGLFSIFTFCEFEKMSSKVIEWIKAVSSGVFTGAVVTLIVSIGEYRLAKRKELERFIDENRILRANTIFHFIGECASGVATELSSYAKHLKDKDFNFQKIKKYPEFGKRMQRLYMYHGNNDMLSVLDWIKNEPRFRIHRRELFTEMQRSIKRARDLNISIKQAAQEIRMIPGNQSKYAGFKRLASRTLLSKGLEFDCVIIDLSKVNQSASSRYSSTEMYVAMTRAIVSVSAPGG